MGIYLSKPWKSSTLPAPKMGVSALLVCSYRLKKKAESQGISTTWFEDNFYDKSDYSGHGQGGLGGDSMHHHFQDLPFVAEKDSRGLAMAVDMNLNTTREMAWFDSQIPFIKAHGLSFTREPDHMHMDTGSWSNYSKPYQRPVFSTWAGHPTNGILVEDGVVGPATYASLQRMLGRKGLYHGSIDGILGPQSAKAARTYLKLPTSGAFDGSVKSALSKKMTTKHDISTRYGGWLLQTQLNLSEIGMGAFK